MEREAFVDQFVTKPIETGRPFGNPVAQLRVMKFDADAVAADVDTGGCSPLPTANVRQGLRLFRMSQRTTRSCVGLYVAKLAAHNNTSTAKRRFAIRARAESQGGSRISLATKPVSLV
eukprot:5858079-Pyramimonas_sp.AAC.1